MYKKLLLLWVVLLSGCTYDSSTNAVSNSYHLREYEAQPIRETSDHEDIYYVADEMELAKLLQSRYENNEYETYIESNKDLDLDIICDYLTHVNPFDIRLEYQTNMYQDKNAYTHTHNIITFIKLDAYYEDALMFAKQNIDQIIRPEMNTKEKIKAIHDYLIKHVTYDRQQLKKKDLTSNVFSAYGALFEKKAVCSGYARSFMMYAMLLDIPCLYVTSDTLDHAWNYVYDGSTWVYVDVTWDDYDNGKIGSNYLNKTSQEFFKDGLHELDPQEQENFYRKLGQEFFGK